MFKGYTGFSYGSYGTGQPAADFKQMLENFKSGDEMMVFGTVQELATTLSMATDNTLAHFPTESFITELLKVISNPGMHDMANEVCCKFKCVSNFLSDLATQCLTNLMDIFPNIVNSVISHQGHKTIVDAL